MIGAACVTNADSSYPLIAKWREPLLEDWAHRVVVLQVDAANFAAAVIEIEISRQLRMGIRELHGVGIAEVLLNVCLRSQQALLLAAPQRDAHGAIQLEIERLKNPHHLDHYSAARGIIRSAG